MYVYSTHATCPTKEIGPSHRRSRRRRSAPSPLSLSPCSLCSPMDDISDPVYDVPAERSTKQLPTPPVAWKDPRFQPAIDSVRNTCGFVTNDR